MREADFAMRGQAPSRPITGDVEIDYTNHRGERRWRRVLPMKLTYGLSEWHPGNQWILLAHCHEKNQAREFAMSEVHGWRPVAQL